MVAGYRNHREPRLSSTNRLSATQTKLSTYELTSLSTTSSLRNISRDRKKPGIMDISRVTTASSIQHSLHSYFRASTI